MRIWLYDEEECTAYLQVGKDYFEFQLGVGPPMIVFIDTPEDRLALQRLIGGLTKLLERPLDRPKDFPDGPGILTCGSTKMPPVGREGIKSLLAEAEKNYGEEFYDGQIAAYQAALSMLDAEAPPKSPPNEPYRGPDWY